MVCLKLCIKEVGIEFFFSKSDYIQVSDGKNFVLFRTMVPEKGFKKDQKWGLESVGVGRFGVGIEIGERFVATVSDSKLAFQSVKRTLFLSLNSLHLRH